MSETNQQTYKRIRNNPDGTSEIIEVPVYSPPIPTESEPEEEVTEEEADPNGNT